MINGGEPPHGDFIAYLERIVGKPPSTPEEIIRLARAVSSGKASASARAGTEMVKPANAENAAAGMAPRAKPALPTLAIGDADLAVLAPIGRGLTLAGFALIGASIFLGPWLPLPSPMAGAALIFLGVILRRVGRGALGAGRQTQVTRKT
jgi:hypothetical protein